MSDPALPWLGPLVEGALRHSTGHALLLHGPRGVGQFEMAMALAAAWLCEDEGSAGACGGCGACRLVAAQTHPDLLVLIPESLRAALGWAEPDDGDRDRAPKAKPSKEIKVDAVRALVAFSQTTAARSRGKVALIHPAERMNEVSANTLLKTLEEPPGDMRFVLSSAAPHQLLPTIRSRCQALAMPLPPPAQAVAWLEAQGVERPEVLLAASGGRPLDAAEAAAEGLTAPLWLRLPELVARGEAAPLAGIPLPRLVDALQKFCLDLLRQASSSAPRHFPASALPPSGADRARLLEWSVVLQAAARDAEHPLNATLAAESLILQGRRVFVSPRGRGGPAHSINSAS